MHDSFVSFAMISKNESLLKTEALFVCERNRGIASFTEHFYEVCVNIIKKQGQSLIHALSSLEYTMLFTNIMERRYIAEVWAYGDYGYLDKHQCLVGEFDVTFLFVFFDELWNKLLSARKMYVGKVSAKEITGFMLKAIPDFYSYFVKIVRSAIKDCTDDKMFIDIVKNEVFRVTVGDYMKRTAAVFILHKNIDMEAIGECTTQEYAFRDYSYIDLSGYDFNNTDFQFSKCCGSILNYTVFNDSILHGVSFTKAQMNNCQMGKCVIFEADFSYAKLNGASLVNTLGYSGLPEENEWSQAGFLPVMFYKADLTDANLQWANLSGADFKNANLTRVDFKFANLVGADFRCANLTNANFVFADLTCADFTGAILENTVFICATTDDAIFTEEHYFISANKG